MSVIRTLVGTFATKGVGLVSTLLVGVIVSRTLLPAGKGEVDVLVMFAALLLLFAYPSLEEPQLRLIGEGKRPPGVLLANGVLASLLFGLLIFAVFELVVRHAPGWLSYEDRASGRLRIVDTGLLRVLVLSSPFTLLQRLCGGLLQGLRDMRAFNQVFLLHAATLFVLIVVLVPVLGLGVLGAVAAHAGAAVVGGLAAVAFALRRPEIRGERKRPDPAGLVELVRGGVRLHGGVVAAFVILQSDQLVLNRYHGPASVGIYAIAVALTGHLRRVILQPVKEVVGSRLPKLMGDPEALADAIARSCRHTVLLVALPALGLLVGGWLAIRILYGAPFVTAYVPLIVLLPGSLFWSVAVILSYWLIGANRYLTLTAVGLGIAATNLVLNLAFIPAHGMLAASLSSTLCYGIHMGIFTRMVSRATGVPAGSFLWPRREDLHVYRDALESLRRKLGRGRGPASEAAGPR